MESRGCPKPWRFLLVERDIKHFYGDNFPASHVSKNRRVVVFFSSFPCVPSI